MRRNAWFAVLAALALVPPATAAAGLHLSQSDTLEMPGLSVLVHQNAFHPVFHDEKIAGIEMILHGERLATDGEVRLEPTPEQWDPVPDFVRRTRGPAPNQLIVDSGYADEGLKYHIEITAERGGFRIAVHLDEPLPAALAGKAGFNLDFLPTSYFGKSYMLDRSSGIFPRHPTGPMKRAADGSLEPVPLASGKSIVLAPEDPLTRVAITSDEGPLMLYDARDSAQNGWFVVRTLIPPGRTHDAVVWHVRPHVVPHWTRQPVVSFNQAGYTPGRAKVAIIELDPLARAPQSASVLKLDANGRYREVFRGRIKPWGRWLRYNYASFDFSRVREPGVYAVSYAGIRFNPFRIADDVYAGVWHASLDTFLAVEMDHVAVRENYRVWHGPSHLDDARQAPPNHQHFDGYATGPNLDSPFAPGEHIPGINVGGWYDAGDFDIRTQSQTTVVRDLAMAREDFGLDWDDMTVDEAARSAEIRRPDGVPDAVEQVRHGVLQLLAQYDVFGHAIPGIIAPTLHQYTHLGDAGSKTDRMIYSPAMAPDQNDGVHSGVPDDRWAFTTRTTGLEYGSAAALAAASRVLRGYDDALAQKCLDTAIRVWNEEHKRPVVTFGNFNTTGRDPRDEEISAAVELILATKGQAEYTARLKALLPVIRERFMMAGWLAARALPFMDSEFRAALAEDVSAYKAEADTLLAKNPFGVPISPMPWGGSHWAAGFAVQMYVLHQAFPAIVGTDYTLRAFDYVLGRHPASNVSYVSTVGTSSRLVAYGNNRADFGFIPGGMIPGVRIVRPDFPELKEAWPFLWYENEYVIDTASAYILAANAAEALAKEKR